jgi:site-specific recombinase XerD
MIGITKSSTGELRVNFPYDPELVEKIKTIPGRRWVLEEKCWTVPDTESVIKKIISLFGIEEMKVNDFTSSHHLLNPCANDHIQLLDKELKLRGYSPLSRKAYRQHIHSFSLYIKKNLSLVKEGEIKDYLYFLIERKGVSRSYINQAISALKFFYVQVLKSSQFVDNIPRPRREKKLPVVLSREEIIKMLNVTINPKHRLLLMVTYSAGLRVSEIVCLRSEDIDSDRELIRIKSAKGNKDRYTTLSVVALEALRDYWKVYRPKGWLFPGADGEKHLSTRTAQKIFEQALVKAQIQKSVTIHVLRHSYATHSLEDGVDLRYLQELLGHSRPETTMIYTHVTQKDLTKIRSPLDNIVLTRKSVLEKTNGKV